VAKVLKDHKELGIPDPSSIFNQLSTLFSDGVRPSRPSEDESLGKLGAWPEPETEVEAYSMLGSLFNGLRQPLSTLLKTIQEESRKLEERVNSGRPADIGTGPLAGSVEQLGSGGKTLEERKEWVDPEGNVHVTVTKKIVDAGGRETGTSIVHTIRGSSEAGGAGTAQSSGTSLSHSDAPGDAQQKGWFWKK
jgi:hypothetical protein